MKEGFDPKVKTDQIVISGLKDYKIRGYYSYKIDGKIQQKKAESMKRDYKIDKEKAKELESKFLQAKQKINFDNKPKILRDGKLYVISKGCLFIYDNMLFNKLHEIKLQYNCNDASVIQLDNQDLIILLGNTLIIYRLIKNNFVQVQEINDNKVGYPTQTEVLGCERYTKIYSAEFIKEISGNRFILISNYGYKIYSLNEKNEYILTLLEDYHKGLKTIIELDKNNFIFYHK